MKKFLEFQLGVLVVTALVFSSFTVINYQQPAWEVPAEYKNLKNPVKKTDNVLAEGKTLYDLHCASCHGAKGKGDGKKSEHLAKSPADLSLKVYQGGLEGEYFYKIKVGRNGLHSFKNKMDDTEIWSMMHYMHSFK